MYILLILHPVLMHKSYIVGGKKASTKVFNRSFRMPTSPILGDNHNDILVLF
jgi:hypothetical protein